MSEQAPRGDGSLAMTVVVAALVATIVGGFVGGVAGVLGYVIARDTLPVETADPGYDDGEWDDEELPFEPQEVDWQSPVEARIGPDEPHRHVYALEVPPDTVFLQVDLECDAHDADLDLRAGFGRERCEDGDWEIGADSAESDEYAWFARMDTPDFARGPLFVEVLRYDGGGEDESTGGHDDAREGETGDGTVAYTLRFTVVRHAPQATLRPGDIHAGVLSPESGHRADLEIVLPADQDVVRLDVLDIRQALEIAVDPEPVLDPETAAVLTETPIGRDHVIVDRAELRLPAGEVRLSATLVDTAWLDRRIPFRVLLSSGRATPPEAARVPLPFTGTTPEERAASAVDAIMAGDDEGSGVVVRADGLVLTAAHVVESTADDEDDVVILVCDDPRREPLEALRARVVRRDDDLDVALLRITGTLHGDALPEGFALPTVAVRWTPATRLAETVHAVGYPMLHEAAERSEITWTRGVIAGFETPGGHELLRFDAEIRGGSSGGALLDEALRLVGILTATHADASEFSATGLALPVTEIPESWLPLLR